MGALSEFLSVKERMNYFEFLVVFIAVLFVLNLFIFSLFSTADIAVTVILAIAVSAIMYGVKRAIAHTFSVKLSRDKWVGGLVFSAVATAVLSALLSVPLIVPILNTQAYNRAKTLRGLKKGEVNVHEKWEISMFSSMALLGFGFLFMFLGRQYSMPLLTEAGTFFPAYVFINFLPYHRLDGAVLSYHNTIMYGIMLLIALAILVLVLLSALMGAYFDPALAAFATFVVIGLVTFKLKLW